MQINVNTRIWTRKRTIRQKLISRVKKFKVSGKPVWPKNCPNFSAKNHSFFSFVIKQDISRQPFCKWWLLQRDFKKGAWPSLDRRPCSSKLALLSALGHETQSREINACTSSTLQSLSSYYSLLRHKGAKTLHISTSSLQDGVIHTYLFVILNSIYPINFRPT